MGREISKTLLDKDNEMKGIFIEVPHEASLKLPGPEQLRLFHLRIIDKKFCKNDVVKWLYWNLGRYVFSRAKLEQFRKDEHLEGAIHSALRVMKKTGEFDKKGAGNELGEMLVYAFLEGMLNAPKLMSRVELSADLSQYKSAAESIHLLMAQEIDGRPYNQLVFGVSNIIGDLQDAVDNAFDSIVRIKEHTSAELQMVEKTVFERFFDQAQIEHLESILLPRPNAGNSYDTAYGVFLGYSLGIEWRKHPNEDYAKVVADKMIHDIRQCTPLIVDKIRANGLDMHSFYVYVVPFDDAKEDKRDIMGRVMDGDIDA